MAVPNLPQKGDNNWDVTLNNALEWLNTKIDATNLKAVQSAPGSPSSPGTFGQFVNTPNYLYLCIATNTWVKLVKADW